MRKEIETQLNHLHLNLKPNWQVFKIDDRGLDFLGYRFFRNKTILRKRNALRIKRRVKRLTKRGVLVSDAQAIISYWGWLRKSNSFYFYNKNVKPFLSIKQARRILSDNAKQHTTNERIYH